MKYTLFVTQQCNQACEYCYVGKTKARMSLALAGKIIHFAFENTPPEEDIYFGFFGGEPLLEFPLLKRIVDSIRAHPSYSPQRVKLSVVSNGTIFSLEIARFFRRHNVAFTVSCDGPPAVHDRFRRFPDGTGSSKLVEDTIRRALDALVYIPVNAVYRPETIDALPATVDYLSSLGVRQIYLNPDFSAAWTEADIERIPDIYRALGDRYMAFYLEGRPHFISLIDSKITVILRGGYHPLERCRMGKGEFAFTPAGGIYPCERLAGEDASTHRIGVINGGVKIGPLCSHLVPGPQVNAPCLACGLREYCMNWCGCSNYFMSGAYNRVGPFLCASERAAIQVAFDAFRTLESKLGPTFIDHLGGRGLAGSARYPLRPSGMDQANCTQSSS